jgi:hypothetical protein
MKPAALVLALALGCGPSATPPAPPPPAEAGPVDAAVEIEARPLGLPDLAAFGWRARGAQPAFRLARASEEAGEWARVAATCEQVLADDPGHLEAAWLLAVAYAKLGRTGEIVAPLARAVAGDFAKWGQASLDQPALQPFLATPAGAAWRRRVEQDRARFVAALGRALVVTAGGELYAVEIDGGRWHRLSRASGTVIGALAIPAARKIAYVTRGRRHELGVGLIDLATGRTSRPVPLATRGPITVAYGAAPAGFWIASGRTWRQLDDEYRLHALPARTARPGGAALEVSDKGAVQLHALPASIVADWDDQGLASAIRIGTSNRVVAVPSPGLIDGNTAAWSPDRVHVAFVAQLDDHCTAGAVNTAAFVADAATGGVRELERSAGGISLAWADRKLAVAGDHGVQLYGLDDAPPVAVEGATALLVPRDRPRCAAPEPGEPAPQEPETDEPQAAAPPRDAAPADPRRAPGGAE